MSLVVGTNVSALYSQNALKTNARSTATTMERLSTGVRVNSAKDDAAGLAIGQNMTSQIRGLNQAVRNINDGINLIQTAEGGLRSITDMLQRMRELAVQSANGTNSDIQRAYLQKEAVALQEQISKVIDTTKWNDKTLLDGSFTGQKIQAGADSGAMMDLSISSAMAVVGGARTYQAVITGNDVGANPLAAGELAINGTAIDSGATASAKDVAAAINLQLVATGVRRASR
jgi:flagellin